MSSLLDRLGQSWGALVRDVFLIVLSILIAFGLDAWWSSRQERARVGEALASVLSELELNRIQLDSVLVRNRDSVASVRRMLARAAEGSDGASVELVTGVVFDPSTGALEALLMSGELGQVEPSELRNALAAWPGVLSELDADSQNWLDVIRRLSARWAEVGLSSRLLGYPGMEQSGAEVEAALLADPLARELLALAALTLQDLLEEQSGVRDRLDRLIEVMRDASGAA